MYFAGQKNMFLTIGEGIADVLHELVQLRVDFEFRELGQINRIPARKDCW